MTLAPLLLAPAVIQIHAFAAMLSLLLGPIAIYRRRRDRLHKIVGYVWVIAMGIVATSAFFIHSFPVVGPFSPIHLLAVLTLWSLWTAMRHVFAGRIGLHERVLRSLYWRGLMIAGLFTFLPGRTVHRMILGDAPELGWTIIALGLALILAGPVRQRFAAQPAA